MKVVLTRPAGRNDALAERVRSLGHVVVECPLIALEPLPVEPLDLAEYDWLVLTSAAAAEIVKRSLVAPPKRVAAVGRATAAAWGQPDLVAEESSQEGLLAALPQPVGRVFFAGASGARQLLADELEADFVPVYDTVELSADVPDADLVVLASGSAARSLARSRTDIPVVTIGPQTTRVARLLGLGVVAEAETQTVDGLVAAIASAASSSPS